MLESVRRPANLAWLFLAGATCLSWFLGNDHGFDNPQTTAALLIAVAFAKVYLIGMHFMELNEADPRLKRGFQAYVAIAGGGLIALLMAI